MLPVILVLSVLGLAALGIAATIHALRTGRPRPVATDPRFDTRHPHL